MGEGAVLLEGGRGFRGGSASLKSLGGGGLGEEGGGMVEGVGGVGEVGEVGEVGGLGYGASGRGVGRGLHFRGAWACLAVWELSP